MRARAALVPHHTQAEEDARSQDFAKSILDLFVDAINKIVRELGTPINLDSGYWIEVPEWWRARQNLNGPRVEWENTHGNTLTAGKGTSKIWKCQLGVGVKIQLLSNGKLVIHVGFQFDKLCNDNVVREMTLYLGKNKRVDVDNGMPSANKTARDLIETLRGYMPEMLTEFTKRIEELPE